MRRDERGAVIVYVSIMIALLVGLGALAVDVGRYVTMNTQLQNAADAVALAASRQLDQLPGAIDRAKAAADQSLDNFQDFSDGGGGEVTLNIDNTCPDDIASTQDDGCIRFLSALPDLDTDPILQSQHATTDGTQARYVEVRVVRETMTSFFAAAVGAATDASSNAIAVAGQDIVVCNTPPMFMCNPTEPDDNSDAGLEVDINEIKGKQIQAVIQGGNTAQYFPGNFAYLCPIDAPNCGASSLMEGLASANGSCIRFGELETKPGLTTQKMRQGLNTRLDWYTNQAPSEWQTDPEFRPAKNTTQGRPPSTGGQCDRDPLPHDWADANDANTNPPIDTSDYNHVPLPRDQTFVDDRIGTGDQLAERWKDYFRINHECDVDGTCDVSSLNGWPTSWQLDDGSGQPNFTRYDIYRWEVEENPPEMVTPGQTIPDYGGGGSDTTVEDGAVQCYDEGVAGPVEDDWDWVQGDGSTTPPLSLEVLAHDRRVFPIASVNCNAFEGDLQGKTNIVPADFIFVFMTEAVPAPGGGNLQAYVEVIGKLPADEQDSLVRNVVQLYRR